jgi:hypothetical protein
MVSELARALFPAESRAAVLQLLFGKQVQDSVSGLARRAELTPRAVAREVANLLKANLVVVESLGGADLVRANLKSPAARPLQLLFGLEKGVGEDRAATKVRDSLAAWGAPLVGASTRKPLSLHATLLAALELARLDGTVLRVLPVVFAKNADQVDWPALKEDARRRKLKAELGMLVELTSKLIERPELKERVSDLLDRRRRTPRYLPEPRSRFEKELAKRHTPRVAAKWGFLMNMTEESFRSTLRKHLA